MTSCEALPLFMMTQPGSKPCDWLGVAPDGELDTVVVEPLDEAGVAERSRWRVNPSSGEEKTEACNE